VRVRVRGVGVRAIGLGVRVRVVSEARALSWSARSFCGIERRSRKIHT